MIPAGRLLLRPCIWAGMLATCACFNYAQPIALHWVDRGVASTVEVDGINPFLLRTISDAGWSEAEWSLLLAVFAEQSVPEGSKKIALPPMAGTWSIMEGRVRFEPQFPLTREVHYRAEFRLSALPGATSGGVPSVAFFTVPRDAGAPTTVVVKVFPTTEVLPENQLKFYVQFSAAMSRGSIYEHIHLRDAGGRGIDLPFLELDEELWDPAMTRLTLLIDPGRIKRGVKPLEDIGPVFEVGKNYSLTVEAECRDANGRPLRAAFEKKFRVGPADRSPPDPLRWKILPAPAGTREPLVVEFGESLDQALALRLISIVSDVANAKPLSGDRALGEREQRWSFVPTKPWQAGRHRLVVASTIEDLAGNNVGKTFDVDVFENVQRKVMAETVQVEFEVK